MPLAAGPLSVRPTDLPRFVCTVMSIHPFKPLSLSEDGHHLTDTDGVPFFWLADTAWELLHRLTEAEAEHYFRVRREQGFTVVQTVILAEADGLRSPDARGRLPLAGDDPCRPNPLYFGWVDRVVELAAEAGLRLALLPTWGDKVHETLWGTGPVVFNPQNAEVFGRYLGERYAAASHVLWLLGGDRPAAGYEPVWASMAKGLLEAYAAADVPPPVIGYHTNGGLSSAAELHDADWLTLNTIQSGHVYTDPPGWKLIAEDRNRRPTKPVLDAEPCYEGHPIDPFRRDWSPQMGRYQAVDVRASAYRSVFAGACGHTYGHHSVWQFWKPGREPANRPSPEWREALHAEGAKQIHHLHTLLKSRGWPDLTPAPYLLPEIEIDSVAGFYTDEIESAEQAGQRARVSMAMVGRDRRGEVSTVLVYVAAGTDHLTIDLPAADPHWVSGWYDVRQGLWHERAPAGGPAGGPIEVEVPLGGLDWVLAFDRQIDEQPRLATG